MSKPLKLYGSDTLHGFLKHTITQGERNISRLRILFYIFIFLQLVVFSNALIELWHLSLKYWIITIGTLINIAFSVSVVIFLKPKTESSALVTWATVIEFVCIIMILLPPVIWPSIRYSGFFARVDSSILPILIIATTFRLSSLSTLVGVGLTLIFLAAVIFIEASANRHLIVSSYRDVGVYLIIIAASAALSFALRRHMLRLINEGAQAMMKEERVRQRFGLYISPELVNKAVADDILKPGGSRQQAVILFSDLRNFTTYAETAPVERLLSELNEYLEIMVPIIQSHGGMIDKYMGDAIMALFGVPQPLADDCQRALHCAIKMNAGLVQLNQRRLHAGYPPFAQGIGISYGEVIAGNIGTNERLQYTVIGDPVNTASRLESLTKLYGVKILTTLQLIENTQIHQGIALRPVDHVYLSGKTDPTQLIEVLDTTESEDQKRSTSQAIFAEGRRLYLERSFSAAADCFKSILDKNKSDKLAEFYLTRCLQNMENPPDDNWNGIFKPHK